jgi:hypothetical protein
MRNKLTRPGFILTAGVGRGTHSYNSAQGGEKGIYDHIIANKMVPEAWVHVDFLQHMKWIHGDGRWMMQEE